MERELERRLFVGQEVVFDDAGVPRRGIIERVHDGQLPVQVTVRWTSGCYGCRVTLPETALEPLARAHHMVPPRGAITKAAR